MVSLPHRKPSMNSQVACFSCSRCCAVVHSQFACLSSQHPPNTPISMCAGRPMRGSPSCRGPISLALFVLAMSCALVSAATAGRTATSGPNYPSSYEDRSYEEGSEGYRGDDSDPTPPRHPSDRDFYNNDEPGRGYDEQPPQHYRPPTPPPNPPPPPPAQCSGCPPGSGCVLCPIGYFSGGNASDTGANSTACEACPDFKTTLEPGATDISQCDYFKRGEWLVGGAWCSDPSTHTRCWWPS